MPRKLSTIGLMGLLYFLAVRLIDPRMADGRLSLQEMVWWEYAVLLITMGTILSVWGWGIFSRFKAGRSGQAIATALFWPIALYFAYTDSGDSAESE